MRGTSPSNQSLISQPFHSVPANHADPSDVLHLTNFGHKHKYID